MGAFLTSFCLDVELSFPFLGEILNIGESKILVLGGLIRGGLRELVSEGEDGTGLVSFFN